MKKTLLVQALKTILSKLDEESVEVADFKQSTVRQLVGAVDYDSKGWKNQEGHSCELSFLLIENPKDDRAYID